MKTLTTLTRSRAFFLGVLFMLVFAANISAQNWRSGWVYIENVETGLVIDVQGNVKANGTTVWPYSLNYGKAQMFQFSEHHIPERYGDDARYIMAYDNSSFGSDFYLSVKTPPMVIVDTDTNAPAGPGTIGSDLVLPPTLGVVDTDRPYSNKKTLRNFVFSIEAKREVDDSPISVINDLSISTGEEPIQIWKILPIPNEPDVYYIQNAHFKEKMVVEPLDFSSGGTLVLSTFTGSDIQKWKILKTAPPEPTNLKLSNFEWEEKLNQSPWYKPWKWRRIQKIKGKLSWTNSTASGLTKQEIIINSRSTNYEIITLGPNKTSYEFNIKSSKSAKTEEHCFTVKAYSKWKAQNWVFSDDECEIPDNDEAPPQRPIPSPGVGKLIVYNCHNDRKTVRLWTLDMTANTGVWKDHGTLVSEWQNGQCLNVSPKEITISDDHLYLLIAIDCGSSPPNATQGTCHKLTSSIIQGGENGTSQIFQIN